MVEVVAENYHNIWAKKKKLELESKGEPGSWCPTEGEPGGRYVFPEVQRKSQICCPLSHFPEPRWRQSPSVGAI